MMQILCKLSQKMKRVGTHSNSSHTVIINLMPILHEDNTRKETCRLVLLKNIEVKLLNKILANKYLKV